MSSSESYGINVTVLIVNIDIVNEIVNGNVSGAYASTVDAQTIIFIG